MVNETETKYFVSFISVQRICYMKTREGIRRGELCSYTTEIKRNGYLHLKKRVKRRIGVKVPHPGLDVKLPFWDTLETLLRSVYLRVKGGNATREC